MSSIRYMAVLPLFILYTHAVMADEVRLDDGSQLKGSITQIANDELIMQTSFAGEITIALERISKLTTDSKHYVQLDSGDRIAGRLTIGKDGQQRLTDTAFGSIDLDTQRINGLWSLNERRPVMDAVEQEHQQEVAQLRESHEQEVKQLKSDYKQDIEQLESKTAKLEDPWSGNLAFGLNGARGNTERFGVQGRGELFRKTEFDRLSLYLESNYQSEDGSKTVDEQLAGARLERDFTDRWFVFGNTDFEIDEFEKLDLRALAITGVGYFFIREETMELKGRGGAGYQFESFSDGTSNKDPLAQAGYDFMYKPNGWLKLLHDLTYYTSFNSPAEDFRVVTNFTAEMPLGQSDFWKLRAGMRNQYDNQPAAGAESNDTTYQLNLVYDWQ